MLGYMQLKPSPLFALSPEMVDKFMQIAGRTIGPQFPPYVIAEMSANHNGNIDTTINIITAAKQAGADALKMQTYTPDTMTLDCGNADFQIHGGLWDGWSLYKLYE